MHDLGIYKRLTPVAPGRRLFPQTVESKTCSRCGVEKPLDQFHRNKGHALGRDAVCASCRKSGARRGVDPRIAQYENDAALAIVQSRFALNNEGAVVYRSDAPKAGRKAGEVAGSLRRDGYREIRVTLAPGMSRLYKAHRIAFALHHSRWPGPHEQVDHIDQQTESTDPGRLRAVGASGNAHNRHSPQVDSTSGIRGVCWHRQHAKWRAAIRVDGKQRHLGYFESKTDAGLAYAAAKLKQQLAVPLATICRIELAAFGARHADLNDEEVDELAALARLMHIW